MLFNICLFTLILFIISQHAYSTEIAVHNQSFRSLFNIGFAKARTTVFIAAGMCCFLLTIIPSVSIAVTVLSIFALTIFPLYLIEDIVPQEVVKYYNENKVQQTNKNKQNAEQHNSIDCTILCYNTSYCALNYKTVNLHNSTNANNSICNCKCISYLSDNKDEP